MSRLREDFAETYANMSDDELIRLNACHESLLPEAVAALEGEFRKRQLGDSSNSEQHDPLENVPTKENPPASSWWARLIIILLFSFAGLIIYLFVVEASHAGDQEKFAESTTKMFLYSALALWGMSQTFASRYLTIKRTVIVAAIFYTIGTVALAALFHGPDSQRVKMEQLMAEMGSLGPPSQEFLQKLGQIIQRDPKGFAEFQQRENELEALLDSDSPRLQKVTSLLGQIQGLSAANQNNQPSLALMQRAYDDDSKVFAALREEIACAHVLARSAASERPQFRRICIDASQDKIRPLAEDEETVLRDLQHQGSKVPAQ
jgi:hypothetical protein